MSDQPAYMLVTLVVHGHQGDKTSQEQKVVGHKLLGQICLARGCIQVDAHLDEENLNEKSVK